MVGRLIRNRAAVGTIGLVLIVALIGIFAPFIAPNDPYATDILNKFAGFSQQYPLGTDNLGRCILSRMIYGIRPTLGLAVLTMLGTFGRLFPRDRGRGDHAHSRCNAFISEPDHGVCSGSPVGNQRAECNSGQCVY